MSNLPYILKDQPLKPTKDYFLLRDQGMELIRQYCENTWTDHNAHDPGITIMEVLVHALTDLGYRTDFDMADILGSAVELGIITRPDIGFFNQMDILSVHPLTINDYRRLFMQIRGVRNAWFFPQLDPGTLSDCLDPNIYIDCLSKQLSFSNRNKLKKLNHALFIKGFYRILLELEIDDQFGSLNSYDLIWTLIEGPHEGRIVRIGHQSPNSLPIGEDFNIVSVEKAQSDNGVIIKNHWVIQVKFLGASLMDTTFQLNDHRIKSQFDGVDFKSDHGEIKTLIEYFLSKTGKIKSVIESAKFAYHANRNLCEDLIKIDIIEVDRVAVCMDIDLEPDADMEKVQAEVYIAIENYLNPAIPFKSPAELQDENMSNEDIFNVPFLEKSQHPLISPKTGDPIFDFKGFITDEGLENTGLRERILSSDIINELMEIDGVNAIRNLILRSFDVQGNSLEMDKWCLPIRPLHQPVFDPNRSKILFFKNEIPFLARKIEFLETHSFLRSKNRNLNLDANSLNNSLTLGRSRNINKHYSILNDFPDTYGIGESGLPDTSSKKRKAQAKQLQAYLLIYDQILADHLEQLVHVPELLSVKQLPSNDSYSSYFTADLKNADGVNEKTIEDLFENTLDDNDKRHGLIESNPQALERKNRFLDHLLSRYNESLKQSFLFLDTMYASGQGNSFLRPKSKREIVENKLIFLKEYDLISRNRGHAYNYLLKDGFWKDANENGWNISGLKRRISRALGFDPERRHLYCEEIYKTLLNEVGNKIKSLDADGNSIDFMESSLTEKTELYPHLRIPDRYKVESANSQDFFIHLKNEINIVIAISIKSYDSYQKAVNALRVFWRYYDSLINKECNDPLHEGFHLIEHNLLRPLAKAPDALMEVCISDDCVFCGEEDPYSFHISIYFPYWPDRFKMTEVRTHIENFIREETPAHIHTRICWVENGQMYQLEAAYKQWLNLRTDVDNDPEAYNNALIALIKIMKSLADVHPEAFLHDCEEDAEENPVKLNNTHLGTF